MLDQSLLQQIKFLESQGKSKEEIYIDILSRGAKAEDLNDYYSTANLAVSEEDQKKRTIRIIVTVGAILIGAGIFSFIAANWQVMGKPSKIIIIILSMLATYIVGWNVKEKTELKKTGDALILLGSIIYGGGIFLVGQMFNVRASWPDGFILWMLGVIAMAFALDSYTLYYLAALLGIVAIFGHPVVIFSSFNSAIFTSSLLLLISTSATFLVGWKFRKKAISQNSEIY